MLEETGYYESVFNIQFNAALHLVSGCCKSSAEAVQSVSQNNTRSRHGPSRKLSWCRISLYSALYQYRAKSVSVAIILATFLVLVCCNGSDSKMKWLLSQFFFLLS